MTQTKAELQARVTELEKEVEELTKEVKEGQTKLRNIQGRELFVSGFIYDASIAVFEHDEDEPAHPIGWHDEAGEVCIQGKTKLNSLLEELSNAEESECESCAI